MRDHNHPFELPQGADLNEIRRAYRELARRCQSRRETHGSAGRLGSLHQAREVLRAVADDRTRRAAGREHAFVDEVDIDFPSVSGLVDRMRESFDDAAIGHRLSSEVRLTPKQAGAGVTVPFDVSLRHTCPVCGGRGEVWLEACGACDGSGAGRLPHHLELVVPPGVQDGTCLRFDVAPPYAPATCVDILISVQ